MFHNCNNEKDAKELFRRLAHYLHPDKGGESDLMILLQQAYENTLMIFKEIEKMNIEQTSKSVLKYKNVYEDVPINDPKIDIIKEIFRYSNQHPSFKTSYIESVRDYGIEKGYVTSSQYNHLVKTYYAFRMDKENLSD